MVLAIACFAELRSPRRQASNYGVCRCLIEMSQDRGERLLASDRGGENAVEYRKHKQTLEGLSKSLAAERREDAQDDQPQKKAGQRLGRPELRGVRCIRHSNPTKAAQAKLSQQIA